MKQQIQISVIIPNYNYSEYIGQCIQSILDSDIEKGSVEIIVIDDASTDDSLIVLNDFIQSKQIQLKLLCNNTNLGVIRSRNRGIENAKGEFLFFLDSDNFIAKDCLRKHAELLNQNPELSACYAPVQEFLIGSDKTLYKNSNQPFNYQKLLYGNYIDVMAMHRKSDLLDVGVFNSAMPFDGWEDYDLWLRLGKMNKKVGFIDGPPLSFYRLHENRLSVKLSVEQLRLLIDYLRLQHNVELYVNKNAIGEIVFYAPQHKVVHLFYRNDFSCDNTESKNRVDENLFTETNLIKVKLPEQGENIVFKIQPPQHVSHLRFDPFIDFVKIRIDTVKLFIKGNRITIPYQLSSNAVFVDGSVYIFDTIDSQIFIDFPCKTVIELDEVRIKLSYLNFREDTLVEINELKKQLALQKEQVGKQKQQNQPAQLQKSQQELQGLNTSPIRRMGNKLAAAFNRIVLHKPGQEKVENSNSDIHQQLIIDSGYFDESYYLENNTDIQHCGMEPVGHYLQFGGFEGRNPGPYFNSMEYLELNPDVASSGINPLLHYLKFGKSEGRQSSKKEKFKNP